MYKTCLYGNFLNLYGGGQANNIFYPRDHRSSAILRSDMDPNMPERFLRP